MFKALQIFGKALCTRGSADEKFESKFSFLELSGEIRNQIYECVLVRPEKVQIRYCKIYYSPQVDSNSQRISSNLLAVCRQVNTEATGLFYGDNDFTFPSLPALSLFFTRLGDRVNLIRKISITQTMVPWYYSQSLSEVLSQAPALQSITPGSSFLKFQSGGESEGSLCRILRHWVRCNGPEEIDERIAMIKRTPEVSEEDWAEFIEKLRTD